jgi:uncharacterized protein (TIGR02147 family)
MAYGSQLEMTSLATPTRPQPVLGEYTDFRQYLKDMYEFKRVTEGTGLRAYSYTNFSAAADIKSPNYLKLIIEGRRNLSEDMILKFAKALRLNREETIEFKALVLYGQATEAVDRNQYLKDLSELRARKELQSGLIDQKAWDKVPDWVGWVLYAMADQKDVRFEPEDLQRLFRIKANTEEIKDNLRKLTESGDFVKDAVTGDVSKPREMIEAPQGLPVALIRKLQAELIYLGIESLFRDSPKDREFGGMTMAMTQAEFEQVRFEVRQLRKRLQKDLAVKRKTSKGDRVYQLNIQLFPVTDSSDNLGGN